MRRSTLHTSSLKNLDFIQWARAKKARLRTGQWGFSGEFFPRLSDVCFPLIVPFKWPCPATFLWSKPSFNQLNKQPEWIVRDGLIPVLWFFLNNPKPIGFRSKLLFDQRFAHLIPTAWRAKSLLFNVESTTLATTSKTKRWLLSGIVSPAHCSIEHLESILTQLTTKKALTRLLKTAPLLTSLLFRHERIGDGHFAVEGFHFDFCRRLGSVFCGPAIGSYSHELERLASMDDLIYIDLNEGLLASEGPLHHLVLSKGAIPFNKRTLLGPLKKSIALSRNHCANVCTIPDSIKSVWEKECFSEQVKYARAFTRRLATGKTHHRYPWPVWVEELLPLVLQKNTHNE